MAVEYDVIVVGAGVMGCATAYSLAKQGKKTLLLEQVRTYSFIVVCQPASIFVFMYVLLFYSYH